MLKRGTRIWFRPDVAEKIASSAKWNSKCLRDFAFQKQKGPVLSSKEAGDWFTASAANLKFLSILPRVRYRNLKFESRTRNYR
jgi:hypothetical protein